MKITFIKKLKIKENNILSYKITIENDNKNRV